MKYLRAVVPVGVTLQLPRTRQTKLTEIHGSENVAVLDDSVTMLWFF